MASWLSEDLNEREVVTDSPARLNGWSLTNTGTEARFVAFKDGDKTGPLVVVPAGDEKNMLGLDQPFPKGLSVESLEGDGTLIANVFFSVRSDAETEEEPPETEEEP